VTVNSVRSVEYDAGAKSFHWLTAALIGTQFIIGLVMPELHGVTTTAGLISLHFSLGVVILGVMAARLLWRFAAGVPAPEPSLPRWQHQAASFLHAALYALLFALIFCGWAYASSHGLPVPLFGFATLPALFAKGSALGRALGELHSPLAWTLLGVLGLHIAAALAHQFLWRDRVMTRMLPRLQRE